MNKEKDFFKTCFNTVAGLEVKNESQAIAKEVVLSEIENLQQENKQLKEQLLVTKTNEETFRLEMKDITQTLGLDEDTIFDDVKTYARSLKENKILRENAENNDKVADKVNWENQLLKKENKQLKEEKRKVRDYINKHCVNEKISKEVGYKCYTMADTNELEKIMKILGDDI